MIPFEPATFIAIILSLAAMTTAKSKPTCHDNFTDHLGFKFTVHGGDNCTGDSKSWTDHNWIPLDPCVCHTLPKNLSRKVKSLTSTKGRAVDKNMYHVSLRAHDGCHGIEVMSWTGNNVLYHHDLKGKPFQSAHICNRDND
ncbi:hypothetical protein BJ138DRAFT_1152922, partial [Hygrophoropsis aurantiaca]